MPFLKALLLRCFLPLRFRDMRRMSRRARRRASSSDGGSPDGGFGIGGAPPPRVSLIDSSFLTAFRASLTFLGGPGRSLNSFLATCSASFLSRMTCVGTLYCVGSMAPPRCAWRSGCEGWGEYATALTSAAAARPTNSNKRRIFRLPDASWRLE